MVGFRVNNHEVLSREAGASVEVEAKSGNRLTVQLVELKHANDFIRKLHRHHKPAVGHRFSLGAFRKEDGVLVGVCVCGRPVARLAGKPLEVLEVARLCTDGERNACSALYGKAARIAREMGFRMIQTYILDEESGGSLKASGWSEWDKPAGGGRWAREGRGHTNDDHPLGLKRKYFKLLNSDWLDFSMEEEVSGELTLF